VLDCARIEEERAIVRDRLVGPTRRARKRRLVIMGERTRQQRRMRTIGQHGVNGRGREDCARFGRRRMGIDRNARPADPLDGEERLDRGETVAIPKADLGAIEAAGEERAREAVDVAEQLPTGARPPGHVVE